MLKRAKNKPQIIFAYLPYMDDDWGRGPTSQIFPGAHSGCLRAWKSLLSNWETSFFLCLQIKERKRISYSSSNESGRQKPYKNPKKTPILTRFLTSKVPSHRLIKYKCNPNSSVVPVVPSLLQNNHNNYYSNSNKRG